MIVRPERPDEQSRVHELVAAAFGQEEIAALVDDLRASDAWRGLSFVAEQDGLVVGHVAFSRGWLDAPDRLVEVLVLSPLSVHPDRQRAGVGRTLVLEVMDRLVDRPEPLVFLEGSPTYYPRLGFEPAEPLGFARPSVRIPPPAFQVRRLPSYRPSLRGALVYPDAFWRHDAVGLRG